MNTKKKTYGFYVFGITYMQDLLPILLNLLRNGDNCWLCYFDSLRKKRQFYFYEKQELENFMLAICRENKLQVPKISFYSQNDNQSFEKDYNNIKPDVVFLQGCKHKSYYWLPTARSSKLVNLAWHWDVNESSSFYKIDLNIVSKENYVKLYKNFNFDTKFFGNLKTDYLEYLNRPIHNFNIKQLKNTKSCFVAGTHIRFLKDGKKIMGATSTPSGVTSQGIDISKNQDPVKFVEETIKYLRSKEYSIIWKEREKGYPRGPEFGWDNVLNHTSVQPDIKIKKDLNFPTTLISLPLQCDITIVFNSSTVFDQISMLTNKVVNIDTNNDFRLEMQKIDAVANIKKNLMYINSKTSAKIINYVKRRLIDA